MLTTKQLSSLIKSIGAAAAKQREQVQQALIGCAYHAQVHRNTTPFDQLFTAVGNGVRKEGMLKWASLYAPVHFKDGQVILSDKRQKETAAASEAQVIEALEAAPLWCDLAKPEPVANPWDHSEQLAKLREYMDNFAKKAKKNNDTALVETINLMSVELTKAIAA